MAARVDAGPRARRAAAAARRRARRRPGSPSASSRRSARRTSARAGSPAAACSAGLALVPVAVADRARRLAGRGRRPDLARPGTGSPTRRRAPRATRRTGSPRPRPCARTTGTRRSRSTRTQHASSAPAPAPTRSSARATATNGDVIVRHAHGYFVQTLSDLGWVGVGLSLLAALAWVLTAARALGMRRRDRGLPFDAERVGAVDDGRGVVVFARALRDRLDVVRARQRRAGAAARGLGGRPRAAARAAGRAARRRPPPSPPSRAAPRAGWRRCAPAPVARACSPRWRSRPRCSRRGRPTSPCAP